MDWLEGFGIALQMLFLVGVAAYTGGVRARRQRDAAERLLRMNDNEIAVLNKRLDEVLLFDNNHEAVETLARAIARTVGYDPDASERSLHVGLGHTRVVTGDKPLWEFYVEDAKELLKALREGKTGG